MQKQEKIYAIRHLSFFYTDEWYESLIDYTDHTGHITDLFDNKEDAEKNFEERIAGLKSICIFVAEK